MIGSPLLLLFMALMAIGGSSLSLSVVPLTANWTLFSQNVSNVTFHPITVPNTVVGALVEWNAARIQANETSIFPYASDGDQDPFFGKNLDAIPTENFTVPWTFENVFPLDAPPPPPTSRAPNPPYYVLQLNGVNYAANVSLNGLLVANTSTIIGGIRRYLLDVDGVLLPGGASNRLEITVVPPLHSWTRDLSFSFLDWAPFPQDNSMGIWRDVNILALPRFQTTTHEDVGFYADGISVSTIIPDDGGAAIQQAFVTIVVTVRCFPLTSCVNVSTTAISLVLSLVTTYPGLESLVLPTCNATTFYPSMDGLSAEAQFVWSWEAQQVLVVQNPLLWWPWQMGGQPLFNITVQLEGFNISDAGTRFGLRQMTQSKTEGGACQLQVNNVPLLIRGGGWAPDLFYRISRNTANGTESRIQHQLEMVKHMNLNTVRLEGKFEYRQFFEIASELGLLVIPGMECCTSWQNWGEWTDEMTTIAKLSVQDQIRRLGHYACNVAFLASSDELPPPSVESMYRDVIHGERWPNPIIAAASEQTSSITGSTGVKMTGPYSWVPPVYWLANTDGEMLNFGGAWGFLTEGGPGEAPMTYHSWSRTVPEQHVWNATEGALSSWWDAHMGNPLGRFGTLRRFVPPLNARFGESKSAQEFCYKSQLQNYEGIRAMFEGYSKMKHHNATGVIQWMMNDAYPNHLWHLYDYYLVAGGGYYGARAAGEALHVMLSYVDGSVSLINNRFTDYLGPYTVQAWAYVTSPEAQEIFTSDPIAVDIVPSDASLHIMTLNLTALAELAVSAYPMPSGMATTYLVRIALFDAESGEEVTRSWYILSSKMDVVNFSDSNGLWTNCSQWADFTSLQSSPKAMVAFGNTIISEISPDRVEVTSLLVNESPNAIALFAQVAAMCVDTGLELAPSFWDDNYITLLPQTNRTITGQVYRAGCQEFELVATSYLDFV